MQVSASESSSVTAIRLVGSQESRAELLQRTNAAEACGRLLRLTPLNCFAGRCQPYWELRTLQ